ncbi:hypothetical protein NADE_006500 [Nannochloris sp. 'desiccata']|nr:hypothetical protein KSW81_008373 [Chlorella desiccata (nom. nud.)]KAH7619669.1 hypothetical protein NADE_006500 [Chlorella desiccata (nom. nud.)]
MDTPITPHGEVIAYHPLQGPKCFCEEPTILQLLNGRACCPADVMLLDTNNRPSKSSSPAAAAAAQSSGTPLSLSPMSEDVPIGSPLSPGEVQLALADSTTPNNNVLSSGRTPAAPSKRSTRSSTSSRVYDGGAARSLTPLFNGCGAAASRAQQLGGRFAKRRPQALTVAKMQRQMSGSSSQERGTTAIPALSGSVSKKRVREELPRRALTTAGPTLAAAFRINKSNDLSGSVGRPAMSVQTVSRGPEVRKAWNGNRGGLQNSLSNGQQQE